jgi:hypothetical protein
MERMSSPSLASTVLISCPFESRKCNLILNRVEHAGEGDVLSETLTQFQALVE